MPVIGANGVNLYCEVRGSGPPILFISGAFSDAGHFASVAELLAARYTVITYDRRGYSRSSSAGGPTSTPQQADDAAGLVAALSLAPAFVYGNSSGATIALDLLIRHPESVRAAILHEPALFGALADPEHVRSVIGAVVENGMAAGGHPAAAEAFFRFVAGDANWDSIADDTRTRVRQGGQRFFQHEFGRLETYHPEDAALASLKTPVQVLVSDQSAPLFAEAATWLAVRLGVPVAHTPGTHTPQLDHPIELADRIRMFFDACEHPTRPADRQGLT